MARPVVFDSDGGVDDAAALWWACTDPDIDLVAVTAVGGNVEVGQAAANLATVLHAAGRPQVPVFVGVDGPVGPTPPLRRAERIHGTDGLGDAGIARVAYDAPAEPAHEALARLVADRPGQLTVVATGPLSNLARAIGAHPGLPGQVADLIVMGGSARVGGNARPAAEANVAHDPEAAAAVVAASWARPPLLVGLDVTLVATLTDAEFALLGERRTRAAAFLAGPLTFYRPSGSTFSPPGECPCHDLLAMMCATHPELVGAPELSVAVDTGRSAAWGATVVDFRELALARHGRSAADVGDAASGGAAEGPGPGRWRVALEVDVPAFRGHVRGLLGA